MTRDEARTLLENSEGLEHHVWYWYAFVKGCSSGCCDDSFTTIEETLDDIEATARCWSNVRVI